VTGAAQILRVTTHAAGADRLTGQRKRVPVLGFNSLVHRPAVAFCTRGFGNRSFSGIGDPVLLVTGQAAGFIGFSLGAVDISPVGSMTRWFVPGVTAKTEGVVPDIAADPGIIGINYPSACLGVTPVTGKEVIPGLFAVLLHPARRFVGRRGDKPGMTGVAGCRDVFGFMALNALLHPDAGELRLHMSLAHPGSPGGKIRIGGKPPLFNIAVDHPGVALNTFQLVNQVFLVRKDDIPTRGYYPECGMAF